MSALKVGFIGLGDQGAPMATAIADHFELHVWARRPASYESLGKASFIKAENANAVAAAVDVLCLCLRGDADLAGMLDDGLATALGSGKTLINHATGDPAAAKRFAEQCQMEGVAYLDAPVSGGRPGAEARTLTCFVGGETETLERCRSIIACHSTSIVAMGAVGTGQMTKLFNNGLTISNLRNVVEVFRLAEELGLSLSGLQQAFEHSSGGSFILQAIGTKITPEIADHIAELNRTDIREFAEAVRSQGADPQAVYDWGIKGPDGLVALVDALTREGGADRTR